MGSGLVGSDPNLGVRASPMGSDPKIPVRPDPFHFPSAIFLSEIVLSIFDRTKSDVSLWFNLFSGRVLLKFFLDHFQLLNFIAHILKITA